MTEPRIVLVHGWGFGPEFWAPVVARLPGRAISVADLGFYGQEGDMAVEPLRAFCQGGGPVLAVGHSLGFLLLATQVELPKGSFLAGINAFGRFAAGPDFSAGVAPRLLARMMRGLEQTPLRVVNDFRARCGASSLPEQTALNAPALASGLTLLCEGEARATLADMAGRMAVLAGENDPVVPKAMTVASLPKFVACRWSEGGHLLPQTAPETCATFVARCHQTMRKIAV